MTTLFKALAIQRVFTKLCKQSIETTIVPSRNFRVIRPKKRFPAWLPRQDRNDRKDAYITPENQKFIKEVIEDKYGRKYSEIGTNVSPLNTKVIEPKSTWTPASRRTGVIAKKIGIYPMWLKNGTKVTTTLLQVIDNHVIKYIPPEEWRPVVGKKEIQVKRKLGCLVVGAESVDPQTVTKEYLSIFEKSGVLPKKLLTRFAVTPDAILQPGTPLLAGHFAPNQVVDIRAKTIDRGFQGVMKRWGFHGMPATHGVTKTHRRGGNIGSGGAKARVMPGTKMPGHMGNRLRIIRGYQILRVNTKYNVIWVQGQNIPGETNTLLWIYDTLLPLRKLKDPPQFPTYLPSPENTLPEDMWSDLVHQYGEPTIEYQEGS